MITDKVFKMLELREVRITALGPNDAPVGNSVKLPAAISLKLSLTMDSKELKGDSELIDIYSKVTKAEVEMENGQFSLDAMCILMGGTISSTASTLAWDLLGSHSTPGYFKLEGRWTYVNSQAADAHIILPKVKVTQPPSFTINDASGNFGTASFKATAVRTNDPANLDKWIRIQFNETATPLATTAASMIATVSKASPVDLTFSVSPTSLTISNIKLDGTTDVAVTSGYTYSSGSLVLKGTYLATLAVGNHAFVVLLSDGSTFTANVKIVA